MRVLAYITTKRKPEVFLPCMEYVLKTCPDADFFVLNNGQDPRDFPLELFKRPRVMLMQLPVNVGHPCGVNFGINFAVTQRYDYFFKLDDDVTILTQDWYAKCLQLMAHDSRIGIIGAKILNPDEQTIQWAYTRIYPTGWTFHRGEPRNKEELCRIYRVNSVQSSFFFVRVEHILKTGYFDLLFSPSQYEDADYCFRMWLQGFHSVYDGRIEIVHHDRASSDEPMRRLISNAHAYTMNLKYNGAIQFGLKLEAAIDQIGREIILPAEPQASGPPPAAQPASSEKPGP